MTIEPGLHQRPRESSHWPAPPAPQPSDIEAAMALIESVVAPTPLVRSDHLSERFGRSILLKLEMLSPVRSFKHRGALVAVDALAKAGGVESIVTASTGNHGQGVAYAGNRLGLSVVVIAPHGTAAEKLRAMRRLGADVQVMGDDLAEAQRISQSMETKTVAYLEDGEDPGLMAGAATVTTEILKARPTVGSIIYPVGGGNLVAGALLATRLFDGMTPTIVGAQSTAAPAVTVSWLEGAARTAPCTTFAGGLATTRPGEMALSVMNEDLTTMVLVTEDDLRHAMAISMYATGIAIEGASAASVAALERFGPEFDSDEIVLVLTGNWCSHQELSETVERFAAM